jgi:hypothetical protein
MSETLPAVEQQSKEGDAFAEELGRITALVPPLIREAQLAFQAALPQLLRERPGQWVAFHGTRPLGFARTKTELYQRCLQAGHARGEFLVRLIRPQPGETEVLGPFEST